MYAHCCGIVPPHLLRGIAASAHNDETFRLAATRNLLALGSLDRPQLPNDDEIPPEPTKTAASAENRRQTKETSSPSESTSSPSRSATSSNEATSMSTSPPSSDPVADLSLDPPDDAAATAAAGATTSSSSTLSPSTSSSSTDKTPWFIPKSLFDALVDSPSTEEDTKKRARSNRERLAPCKRNKAGGATKEGVRSEEQKQKQSARHASTHKTDTRKTDTNTTGEQAGQNDGLRVIFSAQNSDDTAHLPGTLLRKEAQPPVADDTQANEAYDNCGRVLAFYRTVFDWRSINNHGMVAVSTVHFGQNFDNALWDPDNRQMVYGDGGELLRNFTACLDVVGHEMTHGVSLHTCPLEYHGQSGALNEHISDVFGVMIKQWVAGETAADADWLVGEGCLLPDVPGVALRSMKAPGTAYDDPRLGRDPQPAHMDGFRDVADDFGGAHLYSGIPNRAFYLTAVALGGHSWDRAGQIWWKTLTTTTTATTTTTKMTKATGSSSGGSRIGRRCTFAEFATATVDAATALYGAETANVVRMAWAEVGVDTGK
ncbi:hypothetical protein SCUCBS95973_004116 [Sporothrix curviconia]|uniref:Neutral metalloproteinase n=1 Tax=Sporothrix curviconia TaxID=1260050 RepID=A0ABP0BL01_9PEZI